LQGLSYYHRRSEHEAPEYEETSPIKQRGRTMEIQPEFLSHPIFLRLRGVQYKVFGHRFQNCAKVQKIDNAGFLESFLIEIPRTQVRFASERFRFQRLVWFVGDEQIYLVFAPCVISREQDQRLRQFLCEHNFCQEIMIRETNVQSL